MGGKTSMCSVAQSCPTLCDPMDCSPPGSSVHGILQARILEWVAICFSRGFSPLRNGSLALQEDSLLSEPQGNYFIYILSRGFPDGSVVKNLPAMQETRGSIPGSERSPGEGIGNPLQYSCLGNPMDREAWWATVHRVTKESDMT